MTNSSTSSTTTTSSSETTPSLPGLHQSGTRIVWESFSTSDGAQDYWSFYDLFLDTPCTSRKASDGQLRCLPGHSASTGLSLYADAGCTKPLAMAPDVIGGCLSSAPTYAIDATNWTVYPVTGAFTGTIYAGSSPANCGVLTPAPEGTFYSLGTAVVPSTFVAVTRLAPGQGTPPAPTDVDQDGTRLSFEVLVTADGASGPWSTYTLYDAELGQECDIHTASDGQLRCIPAYINPLAFTYADASCTTPVYGAPPSPTGLSCPFAYDYVAGACSTSAYYSIGAQYTGAVFSNESGTCTVAGGSSQTYYDVLPFAATGFEAATTTAADPGPFTGTKGGTRIQLSTATSDDGARQEAGWHDAVLGVDCYFSQALDGVLRCLPDMATMDTYFADASCTTPLAYGNICDPPLAYAAPVQGCTGTYFRVSAPHTAAVYVKQGSGCVAQTTYLPPLYDLGAAVPAGTFVAGTLSH